MIAALPSVRVAFKMLVMPPFGLFLAIAFGLVLSRWKPRAGRWIAGVAAAIFVLLTLPMTAALLLIPLQPEALDVAHLEPGAADAIVVISAGFQRAAPDYGTDTVGALTLQRLRYAATVARASKLPVLCSGGVIYSGGPSIAGLMKAVLEQDFDVPVRWTEDNSWNTHENAFMSAEILKEAEIERIYLVTHAWHMPRAKSVFEKAGLKVIPAPTAFRTWPSPLPDALLPSPRSLRESCWGLHEWFGRVWYALRG